LRPINIAIDGPAGAGKSTIARMVAERLGFVYVDTGAMYRAVTWKILQLGLAPSQSEQIAAAAHHMSIALKPGPSGQLVYVDGTDVTEAIRSTEVTRGVSEVAAIGEVRHLLAGMQKDMAASKGVVMDGRDIGTHVLPDAELKVFLTADVRERASRRLRELQQGNPGLTLEELERDMQKRDKFDAEREISPLAQAADAVLLDSTGLSIDQVAGRILDMCKSIQSGGKK